MKYNIKYIGLLILKFKHTNNNKLNLLISLCDVCIG